MTREWKPGDVALVEAGCWANRKVALRLDEGWSHVNGVNLDGDGIVTPVRPLVVIDVEDREQVERFVFAYFAEWEKSPDSGRIARPGETMPLPGHTDAAQAALRSLLAPPKPPEPTAYLAAVVDVDGNRWHISEGPTDGDKRWYSPDLNTTRAYADITAVKVLSEGVA